MRLLFHEKDKSNTNTSNSCDGDQLDGSGIADPLAGLCIRKTELLRMLIRLLLIE